VWPACLHRCVAADRRPDRGAADADLDEPRSRWRPKATTPVPPSIQVWRAVREGGDTKTLKALRRWMNLPRSGVARRPTRSRSLPVTCGGAQGIRTTDLFHAMGGSHMSYSVAVLHPLAGKRSRRLVAARWIRFQAVPTRAWLPYLSIAPHRRRTTSGSATGTDDQRDATSASQYGGRSAGSHDGSGRKSVYRPSNGNRPAPMSPMMRSPAARMRSASTAVQYAG
jgi:hypothetical protein